MRYAIDIAPLGDLADPVPIVRLAVAAERAGWDGLSTWDSLGASMGAAAADPFVALTAVASATERLRLILSVVALPRRRPTARRPGCGDARPLERGAPGAGDRRGRGPGRLHLVRRVVRGRGSGWRCSTAMPCSWTNTSEASAERWRGAPIEGDVAEVPVTGTHQGDRSTRTAMRPDPAPASSARRARTMTDEQLGRRSRSRRSSRPPGRTCRVDAGACASCARGRRLEDRARTRHRGVRRVLSHARPARRDRR